MPKKTPANRRALHIGAWLRARRVEIGRSLREVSEASGYAKGTMSELERGLVDPFQMKVESFWKLAEAYNIKPEALLWRLGRFRG